MEELFSPWGDLLREFGLPIVLLGLALLALYRKDKRIDDLVDRQHEDSIQNAQVMERSAAAIAEAVKRDEELEASVRQLTQQVRDLHTSLATSHRRE